MLLPSLHGQVKERICDGQKAGPLPMDTGAAAGADAAGCEHTGWGLQNSRIWLRGMGG